MPIANNPSLVFESRRAGLERPARLIGLLRTFFRPLLVLVVVVPMIVAALVASLAWMRQPFPGFFLMENAVVPTVSGYDWPPDKAALFHSQVVAVDDRPVHSSAEVYRYVAERPVGTSITYTFRKEDRIFRRMLASMPFAAEDYLETCGLLLICGFSWLTFGLTVGFLQPRTRQARVYLLQGLIAGLYPITGIFLHRPDYPWLTKLYFLLECAFPATWIHLAVVFPVERRVHGLQKLWPIAAYALSGILSILVLQGFYEDPPDLRALRATYIYAALSFVCFIGVLVFTFWENPNPQARARIKAVLPGAVLAGSLAFFALVDSAFSRSAFPVQFGLLLTPLFSGCVAYAIAKHDLFDIDRLVRQSFIYGLLSLFVISAYSLMSATGAQILPDFAGRHQAFLSMAFALVLALALNPLRRVAQHAVDRAFYRTRLDYRGTISELTAIMTTLLDLREIVAQVTRVLTEAMHLESATVCLLGHRGGTVWSRGADGTLSQHEIDPTFTFLADMVRRYPEEFSAVGLPERLHDTAKRAQAQSLLSKAAVGGALPLLFRGDLIGVLALGPKRSGQPFIYDDIEMLRTLANQTAIAVQNARSHTALDELNRNLAAQVRHQTEELRTSHQQLSQAYDELKSTQAQLVQSEKMASLGQLVAGVAHELNNPASFVYGGLANLQEYLQRLMTVLHAYEGVPITDPTLRQSLQEVRTRARLDYVLLETPELMRICTEGSERIKKIVDDLRVFARADQGERLSVDIAEGIDSTLRMFADRLQRAGITVRTDYQNVPRLAAQMGQLNQVWTNLLTNAIDALDSRADGTIDVCVGANNLDSEDPYIEVEVRDNGVGISPAHLEKLFEPFFTTKPIGRGTGLGLSIAYGAIKNHGGTITVQSTPGQGTAVIVQLPLQAKVSPAHGRMEPHRLRHS